MPRYLVKAFYLTSDPLVERIRDFIVNTRSEGDAMNLVRDVDVDENDVAYFEVEEMKS